MHGGDVQRLRGKGATSSPGTSFGRATASGSHAAAQAVGRTDAFKTLAINVAAAPNQRVSGSWSIACRIGESLPEEEGEMVGHDGDTFTGPTPLTVRMRPVVTAVRTTCTAIVGAALARSGRVTVELLGA